VSGIWKVQEVFFMAAMRWSGSGLGCWLKDPAARPVSAGRQSGPRGSGG
jgi:hypothetical protein